MSSVSRRQNFFRAVRRQGTPAWMPLDFGMSAGFRKLFHARVGAGVDPCAYFNFDCRWIGAAATRAATPDWRRLYYADGSLPPAASLDAEWGTGRVHCEDSDDDMQYFPLRNVATAAEVDAYPWPDQGAAYRYAELPAKVAAIQNSDRVAVVSHGMSSFESAWNLRGFETLLADMAEGNAVASRLFDHVHELAVRCAEQVARTGADIMNSGADVATQRGPLMSPAMWRTYVFPILRDSIAAAKRIKPDLLVDYHSCGNVTELIEGFIEAGIDILNPCQPEAMDLFALKRRYGAHVTFHGGIGVQSVLPFGTPAEVREMTRRTIEIMGAGGGYICCTSHNVRPETPWENILAYVETVREFGVPPS